MIAHIRYLNLTTVYLLGQIFFWVFVLMPKQQSRLLGKLDPVAIIDTQKCIGEAFGLKPLKCNLVRDVQDFVYKSILSRSS